MMTVYTIPKLDFKIVLVVRSVSSIENYNIIKNNIIKSMGRSTNARTNFIPSNVSIGLVRYRSELNCNKNGLVLNYHENWTKIVF